FNSEHHQVHGRCAAVAVHTVPAATVATELSTGKTQSAVDAWIPDSSLWVDVARATPAAAKRVQPSGTVIAESPLVIAMPRPMAARTPIFGSTVGWQILAPPSAGGPSRALGLNVQYPDPTQSAVGLAGLIELKRLFGYGRAARGEMATFALNVQVVHPSTVASSLPSLDAFARPSGASDTAPVTLTSEQAVVAFDRTHTGQPAPVGHPAQGTVPLAHPHVPTARRG